MNIDAKIVLTGLSGSQAYGTNTKYSDIDLISLVVPPIDYYCGLKDWGSSGTKELQENGKSGLVEHKFFEIRKAFSLFSNFNPNIIPLLWMKRHLYEGVPRIEELLLENRHIFNSKKVYHTFCGFAHSQLQKMGGVFFDDEEQNKRLLSGFETFLLDAETIINREKNRPEQSLTPEDKGYLAAVRKIHAFAKEEIKKIPIGAVTGRMGANRKEIRDQYGYDTKYLMHAIRSLKMAIEFMKDPDAGLIVNRTGIDADLLLEIRHGKMTAEEGKELADELLLEAKKALEITTLPDEPDKEKINALCVEIISTALKT